jgi:HNH endonuclease.
VTAGYRRRDRIRALVFDHYGRTCAHCGTSEDLQIDHVNEDGKAHREEVSYGRGGANFYVWLIANGFPDGFQTLCAPCNKTKHRAHRAKETTSCP